MRQAWIIAVGTELTLGQTLDTNSPWLAERLAALGVRTTRHVTVPDERDALRTVLLQAAGCADVVLVTGGLGPTEDDLTRPALADAAGVPLELHAPSLAHLRAFFAERGRTMPAANTVQALVPRGGRALPNTCGTAPGLWLALRGTPCYVLPGVPFEMRTMFEREVEPELRSAARGDVILCRRLHTFGLGESELGQRLADLMARGRNPEVGTTAALGFVSVRINAAGPTPATAAERLRQTELEILQRLGSLVFGRDDQTLAGAVGEALATAGRTLSTAESCTGGLVGALLTDVAGSSRYYLGGVISYSNAAKRGLLGVPAAKLDSHGAVSAAVAAAMARGAAERFGSDYAVSITGIAGPAGGSPEKPVGLVFIGLCAPAGLATHEFRFGATTATRATIRSRAAHTALNLLRLQLLRDGPAGPAADRPEIPRQSPPTIGPTNGR